MINRSGLVNSFRKIGNLILILSSFVLAGAKTADAPHTPDLMLHNVQIPTLDALKPRVQAPSIGDGVILETSKNSEILSSKIASTSAALSQAAHWLITGETFGGKPIRGKRHLLSREEAIDRVKLIGSPVSFYNEAAEDGPVYSRRSGGAW